MNTEKQGGRRDAIIEAAYSCMARGGYDRTSTAQIRAAENAADQAAVDEAAEGRAAATGE